MPAQALIRKLSKDQIAAKIIALKAGDLLEIAPHAEGTLVHCKTGPGGAASVAGSPEALQVICDEDSKIVQAEAKARIEAEAAAAETAAKKP